MSIEIVGTEISQEDSREVFHSDRTIHALMEAAIRAHEGSPDTMLATEVPLGDEEGHDSYVLDDRFARASQELAQRGIRAIFGLSGDPQTRTVNATIFGGHHQQHYATA